MSYMISAASRRRLANGTNTRRRTCLHHIPHLDSAFAWPAACALNELVSWMVGWPRADGGWRRGQSLPPRRRRCYGRLTPISKAAARAWTAIAQDHLPANRSLVREESPPARQPVSQQGSVAPAALSLVQSDVVVVVVGDGS